MKEFDFIWRVKKDFPNSWENSVGNDCAVFSLEGQTGLLTTDLLIENTHFYSDIPLQALAYKSLMVSISDILSDGGTPSSFLIGAGVSQEDLPRLSELYGYYAAYCREWGIPIIGGDTAASPVFFLSITCFGKTSSSPWLRRNARPGDYLYVTGELGSSAFGLEKISQRGYNLDDPDIRRHFFPPYRQEAVKALSGKVGGAIDLSDGLMKDLFRILEESRTGAELEESRIPFASTLPEEKKELAFYGGEDYELLFTSPFLLDEADFFRETGTPLSRIGRIISAPSKIILKKNGKSLFLEKKDLLKKGYEHWR